MVVKVRCRCGQELPLEVGQSQVTCPSCQKRFRIAGRQSLRDVFLSYSSNDKAIAEAACAILEGHGIRCWIAPRDIVPGTEWSAAIIEGIEQTRLMVLLYSQHSNQSPQVLREVERAVAKGMPIIPLRLESTAMSKSLEYFISSQHWLDALTPPLEQHLESLATTVTGLLKRPAELPIPDVNVQRAPSASSSTRITKPLVPTRIATLVAAGVVVVAGLAIAGYQLLTGSQETIGAAVAVAEPVPDESAAVDPRDPAYSAEMNRRFVLMDANSDGIISRREFYAAMRERMGPKGMIEFFEFLDANKDLDVTREEMLSTGDQLMRLLDENHSGDLSQSEMLKFPHNKDNKDAPRVVREIMRKFDYSHDGQLDIREVERFLAAPPPG